LYHGDALAPGTAVTLAGLAMFAIIGNQIVLTSMKVPLIIGSAVGDLVVLACGWLYLRSRGIRREHVGLTRARPVYYVAAVLIGVSAWFVNVWIVSHLHIDTDTHGLDQIVEEPPLVATLGALAILPAFTEELMFRGVLARGLAPRVGATAAIVLSALAFAVFHLNPAQMATAFALGIVLAFLTLRARSVVPAMTAHLLNNAIVIIVTRDELQGLWLWMVEHHVACVAVAALVLCAGVVVSALPRQARGG
jgi:membrane protease YdiL (CAAX protease family)